MLLSGWPEPAGSNQLSIADFRAVPAACSICSHVGYRLPQIVSGSKKARVHQRGLLFGLTATPLPRAHETGDAAVGPTLRSSAATSCATRARVSGRA